MEKYVLKSVGWRKPEEFRQNKPEGGHHHFVFFLT
jgi:hypothetical protein